MKPLSTPSEDRIRDVLFARCTMEGYPLTANDVEKHALLLIELIREKIHTLAGRDDRTPLTIIEALNHVLMSSRWLKRDERKPDTHK